MSLIKRASLEITIQQAPEIDLSPKSKEIRIQHRKKMEWQCSHKGKDLLK